MSAVPLPRQTDFIQTPGYTGPERRRTHAQWREEVDQRLEEGAAEMLSLRAEIAECRQQIREVLAAVKTIQGDTAEIVGLFANAKGAIRLLNGFASIAKPITAIVVLCAAIWGFILTVKAGAGPK
ncbi:hypothetical protein [Curvibacter lanceolatus]|uniref:hypothetical protein n=1 Tax=Curvibacter lanceolatus TaxID=86182 RepID=UPI0003696D89|nr:hypothetical protein [Curvibacter lanceolatus]